MQSTKTFAEYGIIPKNFFLYTLQPNGKEWEEKPKGPDLRRWYALRNLCFDYKGLRVPRKMFVEEHMKHAYISLWSIYI